MRRSLAVGWIFAMCLTGAAGLSPAHAEGDGGDGEKFYEVIDGKVDKGTYNGFRRYHASCHTCHGPDGLGSSYAPSMVESLQNLSYDEFAEVVVNGRENVSGSQQSVMPAFGYVNDVMLYIDDIYGYLKARSDGVIGRGRPERHDR